VTTASTFTALAAAGVPTRVLELEHAMSRTEDWTEWERLADERDNLLRFDRQNAARRRRRVVIDNG